MSRLLLLSLLFTGCLKVQVRADDQQVDDEGSATSGQTEQRAASPYADLLTRVERARPLASKERLVELIKIRGELKARIAAKQKEAQASGVSPEPAPAHFGMPREFDDADYDGRMARNALEMRLAHEHALAYGELGNDIGLIRELAPVVPWEPQGGFVYAPNLDCAHANDAKLCEDVRERLKKASPNLCRFSPIECYAIHDGALAANVRNPDDRASPFMIDVPVTSAKKVKGRWTIVGSNSSPDAYDKCIGEFQTDRVVERWGDTLKIERTTWCQKIVKQARKGVRIQVTTADDRGDIRPGQWLRMLIHPDKIRTQTQPKVTVVEVQDAVIVNTSAGAI